MWIHSETRAWHDKNIQFVQFVPVSNFEHGYCTFSNVILFPSQSQKVKKNLKKKKNCESLTFNNQ